MKLQDVSKTFHQHRHDIPALVAIELELADGETLGLVGESGSGKSTLAKTMLGIYEPDEGSDIRLDDEPLAGKARRSRHRRRCGRCRWCSRTPTARSTARGACGGSSSARSPS